MLTKAEREQLVLDNQKLAHFIANKWHQDEDGHQLAMEYLVRAANTWNPEKAKFSAWASLYMNSGVRYKVEKERWGAYLAQDHHDIFDLLTAHAEFQQQQIEPTAQELADLTGCRLVTASNFLKALAQKQNTSLEGLQVDLPHIGAEFEQQVTDRLALVQALNQLTPEQLELVNWYYFEDINTVELGKKLGLTPQALSARLRKITKTLRQALELST